MKPMSIKDFAALNAFYRSKVLTELVKTKKAQGDSEIIPGETHEKAFYKCYVVDMFLTQEPKMSAQVKEGKYTMPIVKLTFGHDVKNFIASWKQDEKKWVEVSFFMHGYHVAVPLT